MAEMKTPGVFIVEKAAFPNSVVAVPTGVAGFAGWTERGEAPQAAPRRVTSLADFESQFGGPPPPRFTLARAAGGVPPPEPSDGAAVPLPGGDTLLVARAAPPFSLHAALGLFFANGGEPAYVASVGSFDDAPAPEPLIAGIAALAAEPEPAILLCPEAARLGRVGAARVNRALLDACGAQRDRFALLDLAGGWRERSDGAGDPVAAFRADVAGPFASFGAAYHPWLRTTLHAPQDFGLGALDAAGRALVLEIAEGELRRQGATETEAKDFVASLGKSPALTAEKVLSARSGTFDAVRRAMADVANLQPPSGAVAGLCAWNDAARGVWKAPANLSIASVSAPAAMIDDDAQADLSAPAEGAAVNPIRVFAGRGVLVWGARTLDGASPEWRHVPVRRLSIMIESSVRLALSAYVFELNDANTWNVVRAMVESFLFNLWKSGAFPGATPEASFAVRIGPGETMTAADVAEGRMRLILLFAPIRPSEFITLEFEQMMTRN